MWAGPTSQSNHSKKSKTPRVAVSSLFRLYLVIQTTFTFNKSLCWTMSPIYNTANVNLLLKCQFFRMLLWLFFFVTVHRRPVAKKACVAMASVNGQHRPLSNIVLVIFCNAVQCRPLAKKALCGNIFCQWTISSSLEHCSGHILQHCATLTSS